MLCTLIMNMLSTLWVAFAALAHFALGQTIHTVAVGAGGTFYDPPTISAEKDDIVTFVFSGRNHSVTQSSFDNPCLPLPGGFNSGLTGTGSNGTSPVPSWDLYITNVSEPIWFFCEATQPESHCGSGMVGVINPPSNASYETFLSSAKAVSGTPTPTPVPILSGIGAFATNTPTSNSTSLTTISSSVNSSSTTGNSLSSTSAESITTSPTATSTTSTSIAPTTSQSGVRSLKTSKIVTLGLNIAIALIALIV